jgi:hypothetical protein
LNNSQIPFFELLEDEETSTDSKEFIHIISKICGINKLPAIFAGYKYLGGLEELKDL